MSATTATKLSGIASRFGVKLPSLSLVELGVLERVVQLPDGGTVNQRIIVNVPTVHALLASDDPEDQGWVLVSRAPGAKLSHDDAEQPVYVVLAISSLTEVRRATNVHGQQQET